MTAPDVHGQEVEMPHLALLLLIAQTAPTFQSRVALVLVDAEAREGSRSVEDLSSDSFRITDGGKTQRIIYFGHQEVPLDLILLIDARHQMRPAVASVAEKVRIALGELSKDDRVGVMAFGGHPNCKADLLADLTADFDAAARSVTSLLEREFPYETNGCSIQLGLIEAAHLFASSKDATGTQRRRAVLAITDDKGAPTLAATVRETLRELSKEDVVVCGVIAHSGAVVITIGPPYRGARYVAAKTGGDVVESKDAGDSLREMVQRLRSRYSLYYAMPHAQAGEERKINVQLSASAKKLHPKAIVRSRTGYVVPTLAP